MKFSELVSNFADYAKEAGLTIERSKITDGVYKSTSPGTIYLQHADGRCGQRIAIVENDLKSCPRTIYGYSSYEAVNGYIDALREHKIYNITIFK